jgi:hypothetical protein
MWWMILVLAVAIFGCGAISIVWIRMEISATAKNCGALEDQREMIARELQELRGQRASILRPSVLAGLVAGRLSLPRNEKIIHVTAREMARSVQSYRIKQGKTETVEIASRR